MATRDRCVRPTSITVTHSHGRYLVFRMWSFQTLLITFLGESYFCFFHSVTMVVAVLMGLTGTGVNVPKALLGLTAVSVSRTRYISQKVNCMQKHRNGISYKMIHCRRLCKISKSNAIYACLIFFQAWKSAFFSFRHKWVCLVALYFWQHLYWWYRWLQMYLSTWSYRNEVWGGCRTGPISAFLWIQPQDLLGSNHMGTWVQFLHLFQWRH